MGSARTKPKTGAELAPGSSSLAGLRAHTSCNCLLLLEFLQSFSGSFSHQLTREDTFSEEDENEDEIERVIKEEEDGVPDAYELQLRFMRWVSGK